ncbi:response regulator [Oscillatoria salina]|uniref:response regulator n=1 Tax=Oscillatoria salina TaxID=331517 RepID=UPI0013B94D87|nr:response regulator [Oscillatoria salina]MBZ8179143.1 response regulator [Oscillatoria salina IIICB1]NET88072.1 response regulator [Kamptonema sp. SIO1D9]
MKPTNKYPILLVEDDSNDVLLIQRACRRATIANPVIVVEDGDEAVSYLSGEGKYADRETYPLPVIMLLDLKLPRRSGLEVLTWLRNQPRVKRLPVVVLTSSRENQDVDRAYDIGVNSYLIKPVAFEDLMELIANLNIYWLLLNEHPSLETA